MELEHRFTVPTGVEEAWAHFQDIASVAQCFPGAQVTGVEEDTFTGTVKVKLGPIALQYLGTGTFLEKDETGHRFVVDAKGKDKRGNGTAGAKVTLTMTPSGDSTDVQVLTDLAVTGKPAQFGRGVMQDVSDKLLGQFVACLEQRLANEQATAPPTEAAAESPFSAADLPAAQEAPDARATPVTHLPPQPTHPLPPPGQEPQHVEAIDLGATVLPVILKSYGKQIAGALVVLVILRWLVRRRTD